MLDVYLLNGYRISVSCYTTECSSKVLEKACQQIDLPKDYVYYFSLFLMRKENDGGITLIRKLMDFEAPYISQRLGDDCKIVIRKKLVSLLSETFFKAINNFLILVFGIPTTTSNWCVIGLRWIFSTFKPCATSKKDGLLLQKTSKNNCAIYRLVATKKNILRLHVNCLPTAVSSFHRPVWTIRNQTQLQTLWLVTRSCVWGRRQTRKSRRQSLRLLECDVGE